MSFSNQSVDIVYTKFNEDNSVFFLKYLNYVNEVNDVNQEWFGNVFEMIKISLHKVEKFLLWVVNIYVFFQKRQGPYWINVDHLRIKKVQNGGLSDEECVPTYSSKVIGSYLHKIRKYLIQTNIN